MSEVSELAQLKEDRAKLKVRVNELGSQVRQQSRDLQAALQVAREVDAVNARAEAAEARADRLAVELDAARRENANLSLLLSRHERDAASLAAIKEALR